MDRDPATHVSAEVLIDGLAIPCDPASTDPGVLSGLKVTWGRDGRLDKPAATTCEFELVDPDGGAGYQDRVKYDSEVRVRAYADDGSWSVYTFLGTVSDLEVARDSAGDTIVKVIAIDHTARMTSINMGDTPWPQQSSQQRWAAINAAIPAGVTVAIPNTVPNVTMAAMDVDNRSIADIAESFAWELGRIPWPISMSASGTLAAGWKYTSGVYNGPTSDTRADRRQPTFGVASTVRTVVLDACDIDLDGTAFAANPDDVPQPIRVAWGGSGDGATSGTYVLNQVGEVLDSTRRFDVTSGVVESSARQVALEWYVQMSKWSEDFDAPWRAGVLRVDPDTVTGIDNFQEVLRYLLDYSDRIDRYVLLQQLPSWTPWRDAANPTTPEPNILGRLQGGIYTFDNGRWVMDLTVVADKALVGPLAPKVDVVVSPGDVVPYFSDTDSVNLIPDPATPWPVGATARFNDGDFGWDGTAWVRGGTAPIYASPGQTVDATHDDVRVRPSPTTGWAARAYATFTDGRYQWNGSTAWVEMVTVTWGTTTTLPHDAPNVLPYPTASWAGTGRYATFSDGTYAWNGSNAWVPFDVPLYVSPGGVYPFAHNAERVTPDPSTAWPPSGTGTYRPYGYATFSDGSWSWRGATQGWARMTEVHPGDTLTLETSWLFLVPGADRSAWAPADYATVNGQRFRWNGNGGWDPWVPTWEAAPEGVAWSDVPAGTSWTEWTGEI